jgi:hypothetical protein
MPNSKYSSVAGKFATRRLARTGLRGKLGGGVIGCKGNTTRLRGRIAQPPGFLRVARLSGQSSCPRGVNLFGMWRVQRLDQINAFNPSNLFDFKSLALKIRKKQIGRFKTVIRPDQSNVNRPQADS